MVENPACPNDAQLGAKAFSVPAKCRLPALLSYLGPVTVFTLATLLTGCTSTPDDRRVSPSTSPSPSTSAAAARIDGNVVLSGGPVSASTRPAGVQGVRAIGADGVALSTWSDASGHFRLQIAAGTYTLRANCGGTTQRVVAASGHIASVTLSCPAG